MWFMPSWGRPRRLYELLAAPGGWPDQVTVLINSDDPTLKYYHEMFWMLSGTWHPWVLLELPAGSRCADAHRYISSKWPDLPFYGLLCDDQWPQTKGWHRAMEKAAGNRYIAVANGETQFPRIRTAVAFGGDLVRAMGSLVPAPVKHNFEDDLWDRIGAKFHLRWPLPAVQVKHLHWVRGEAKHDDTYKRGSADIAEDAQIYAQWLNSPECHAMDQRLAEFSGTQA